MGKKRKKTNQNPSKMLILAGFVILLAAFLLLKNDGNTNAQTTGISPQAQLAQALTDGKPVFAFFHSNNCQSCLDMIAVVNQVYPEFEEQVVLVDINVYDPQNQSLLREVGLQYIPTQMFYDPAGKSNQVVGVMQPEQLREALSAIHLGQ